MEVNSKNMVVFSSCMEPWGGSEELWAQAAEILSAKGYKIHLYKFTVGHDHPRIKKLKELGGQVTDLAEYVPSFARRVWNRFLPHQPYRTLPHYIVKHLGKEIKRLQPELIIISQGSGFDAFQSLKLSPLDMFPYVVITQKVDKNHWANDWEREWIIKCWQGSIRNYFVSEENSTLMQQQFCLDMENAEVVRNPFLTKVDDLLPWNFKESETVRLACVARLYPLDKGQDILLRVLNDKKWRERNLEVSFFGEGRNETGLNDFARFLGLQNVVFKGHVSDINSIWQDHQALVLASRNEGLPLALVEAMLCGRTAIVTNVGGNSEVLDDNVTGFIAKSVDEGGVDEALERAWQRVGEWREIGVLAAQRIREKVPANPPEVFAQKLKAIIDERSSSVHETDD